ncbi:cysteine and glycine-rich protein 2-like [Periplaneta americana]|uniref:cysteine and glycine-rich protein 2-like n=1 Tax=Periplaneta americana TaxID=6978 RepID=UPI0037E94493
MCGRTELVTLVAANAAMPGVPCPRCGRPVYDAEMQSAFGRRWHLFCFSCYNCRRLLDISEATPSNRELYCRPCSSSLLNTCRDVVLLHRPDPTKDAPEDSPAVGVSSASALQTPTHSLRPAASPTAITAWYNRQHPSRYSDVGGLSCRSDEELSRPPRPYEYESLGLSSDRPYEDDDRLDVYFRGDCGEDVSLTKSKSPCFGGGVTCRRCGRKVYHAEMVLASGAAFHTVCFSCSACRKPLDTINIFESHGEIYCKRCHSKMFGPSGYGFGAGAGVLQTM